MTDGAVGIGDGAASLDRWSTDERYRLVARATNDVVWDWDLLRDTILWNEALETSYGWRPAHIGPGSDWWLGNIHPDDRAIVSAGLNAFLDGGSDRWSCQYRFLKGDGAYADVLDRGYLVRDALGAPVRMVGAMLDVTVRSQLEAQFRAVFEGANIGIVQFDPRSVLALRVNAKLCEIWGAPESEIVGRSPRPMDPRRGCGCARRPASPPRHRRDPSGPVREALPETRRPDHLGEGEPRLPDPG